MTFIWRDTHTYVCIGRLWSTVLARHSCDNSVRLGSHDLSLECKPDPSVFQVDQYLNWENHEQITAGSPMSGLKFV